MHEKVQAEIDEIKEAIAEQSGISAIPSKLLFQNELFRSIERQKCTAKIFIFYD